MPTWGWEPRASALTRAANSHRWAPGGPGHSWLWDLGRLSVCLCFFLGEVGYELLRGLLKWGCWAVEQSDWLSLSSCCPSWPWPS